jgi:putative membrane protein
VLREHRFRLDRTATGLRRRRGLLTLTDVTLPVARIQAAIIGSGPLREHFGWSSLKLQSLAKDEGTKGDHDVAPLASNDEVVAILNEINWRPASASVEWHKVSSAYAWSFTLLMALLLIPVLVQALVMPWIGAAGFVAVVTLIALRWLDWRRFRYALDGDRVLIRSGWWKRRLVILPLASIQSVDVTENAFSRRFGTASLTVGVASGRGYSAHAIPSVQRVLAHRLRDKLLAPFA